MAQNASSPTILRSSMNWQEVTTSPFIVRNVDSWTPPDTAAIIWKARQVRRFLAELKERDSVL